MTGASICFASWTPSAPSSTGGPATSKRRSPGNGRWPTSSERSARRSKGEPSLRPELRLAALASFGLLALAGCHRKEQEPEPTKRLRAMRPGGRRSSPTRSSCAARLPPLPDEDAQIASQVVGANPAGLRARGGRRRGRGDRSRASTAPRWSMRRAAEAAVARTRAELKNAVATGARVERVFEHGIAARQEVDDATTRADGAAAAENEAESAARRAQRQVERALVRSPLTGVVVRIFGAPASWSTAPRRPRSSRSPIRAASSSMPTRPRPIWCASKGPGGRPDRGGAARGGLDREPSPLRAPAVDRATGLGVVRVALDARGRPRPPIGVAGDGARERRRRPASGRRPARSGARGAASARRWKSSCVGPTAWRTFAGFRVAPRWVTPWRRWASRWARPWWSSPSSGSPTARPSR